MSPVLSNPKLPSLTDRPPPASSVPGTVSPAPYSPAQSCESLRPSQTAAESAPPPDRSTPVSYFPRWNAGSARRKCASTPQHPPTARYGQDSPPSGQRYRQCPRGWKTAPAPPPDNFSHTPLPQACAQAPAPRSHCLCQYRSHCPQ